MGIQVFVNVDSRSLGTARARSVFDNRNIDFKEMVVGDSEVFELFLVDNQSRYTPNNLNIQDYSVRMGLGPLNAKPSAGTWDMGAQTGLAHDIDATGLDAAITAEVAACEVTQLTGYVFRVIFDATGAQTIPTVDGSGLSPDSTVSIVRTVDGDGTTQEEWIVRMFTNPVSLNTTWENIDLDSYDQRTFSTPMKGIRGSLSLGTAGIYDLMGNASSAVTTVEIELTDGDGRIQTVLQMPVKLTGEVIGQGVTGVAEFDSYLTFSDVGLFVQAHDAILDATTASFTTAQETKLAGIEDGATADQTGAEIKTAYEAEADTNAFTDAEKAKLAGIDTSATDDQTGAEIKTAYEAEADTNAFTDAEKTKLAGVEAGATADQTGAEIKTAYEAEADTNAFTDAEKTKLAGVEAGAEVNTIESDVTGEPTGSDQMLNVVSLTQAEYDAGTPIATTLYIITD